MPLRDILDMVSEKRLGVRDAEHLADERGRTTRDIQHYVVRGVPRHDANGSMALECILIVEALRLAYAPRIGSARLIAACDKGVEVFREMGGVVNYAKRMADLESALTA